MISIENATMLTALAILGFSILVIIMYQLLSAALNKADGKVPDADPETQDDFYVSLQRNRETQERMGR
jgi:hypothetical protein